MSTSFDYLNHLQPPEERTQAVISRHWDHPVISVTVNRKQIALATDMTDFMNAVLAEVGSPLWVLTRKDLQERVQAATKVVIEKLKEASNQVM